MNEANTQAAIGNTAAPTGVDGPHLKKFNAKVRLTTNSGARLEYEFPSTTASPHKALLATIGELSRIAAVAGLEDEVRSEMEARFKAVAEWRREIA